MTATIKNIAYQTGLSVGTISKYLNGGLVKPKNKIVIEQAIESLDYRVNTIAQSLKTNKTRTIGVVIPSIDLTFSGKIVSILESVFSVNSYSVIFTIIKGSSKIDKQKLINLESRLVDALIVIPPSDSRLLTQWIREQQKKLPIIIIDQIIDNKEEVSSFVVIDNKEAAKEATTILVENGHKSIAFIGGDKKGYTTKKRLEGFLEALKDSKININKNLIFYSDFTRKGGYNTCEILSSLDVVPTAIFVTNYDMTIGVIEYLNSQNIKIGKDISVIGFDMDDMTGLVNPSITMVIQPIDEIANYAAQKVLKILRNESIETNIKVFDYEIREGSSVNKIKEKSIVDS